MALPLDDVAPVLFTMFGVAEDVSAETRVDADMTLDEQSLYRYALATKATCRVWLLCNGGQGTDDYRSRIRSELG
jgi:hypothetical protein